MSSQVATEKAGSKRKDDIPEPKHHAEATKRAKATEEATPIVTPPAPNTALDVAPFTILLANTKVESIWSRESKIFFAMRTDTVKDVFKGLIQHNFSSCPVLQKTKNKWYGFLDVANIVKFIVQHFEENTLSEHTNIMQLLEETDNFKALEVNDLMKNPMGIITPYHPIYVGYSLFSAFEVMARSNLHRLAVVDNSRALVSVITQSQMVEFIYRNIALLGAKRSKCVKDMPYNLHEVYAVKPSDIALRAFSLMTEKNVSGVAVCDDDGVLIDQMSMRDLKAMMPDGRLFWRLYKTCGEFLGNVKHSHTDPQVGVRPREVICVTPNDTIETVLGLLVNNRIHRVYIVESTANKKPLGLITLRDIMLEAIPGGHW
jgi:CBS domain-containing protein